MFLYQIYKDVNVLILGKDGPCQCLVAAAFSSVNMGVFSDQPAAVYMAVRTQKYRVGRLVDEKGDLFCLRRYIPAQGSKIICREDRVAPWRYDAGGCLKQAVQIGSFTTQHLFGQEVELVSRMTVFFLLRSVFLE